MRPSSDDSEQFRSRLRIALGSAAGLGVRIRGVLASGRPGELRIQGACRRDDRWIRGPLAFAYDYSGWRNCRVPTAEPLPAGSYVGVGVSLPGPIERSDLSWLDSFAASFALLERGIQFQWEVAGLPSPLVGRPRSDPIGVVVPVPPNGRIVPPSGPDRDANDDSIARSWALRWVVRITLSARESARRDELVRAKRLLESVLHLPGSPGVRLRPTRPLVRPEAPWIPATTEEVAALFPAPSRLPSLSVSAASPVLRVPSESGSAVEFEFASGEGRHLLILGETGMGKSTLLVRLALAASRHGSVVLLDPIGETAERWAGQLPDDRASEADVVSPARYPVPINVLAAEPRPAGGGARTDDRLVGNLVEALRRVRAGRYADSPFWGPRIEEVVGLALRAARAYPHGTLADAQRLIEAPSVRLDAEPEAAREPLRRLRDRLAARPEEGSGASRLLGEITGSRVLREMLCSASPAWDLREATRPGRITMLVGDAASIGERDARYLLAVYLAILWDRILSRDRPEKLFLVLDEAQWFFHESAAEMLRLGRRCNLHVWVASQSLASLPESAREALLTNCADVVLFRGSPAEAREFGRWGLPVGVDRLLSLDRGEAIVLHGKGRSVEMTRIAPLPVRGSGAEALATMGRGTIDRLRARVPPNPDTTASERAILVALSGAGDGGDEIATVRLAALRDRLDPSGAVVRLIGALLARSGGMVESVRDAAGSLWRFRPSVARALLDPPLRPEEARDALARWREIAPADDGPPRG